MKARDLIAACAVAPDAEVLLSVELVAGDFDPFWVRNTQRASAALLNIGGKLALVMVPELAVERILAEIPSDDDPAEG